MDLTEFITARLDEDEAAVRASSGSTVTGEPGAWKPVATGDEWEAADAGSEYSAKGGGYIELLVALRPDLPRPPDVMSGMWGVVTSHEEEADAEALPVFEHIARWDPARVLAEVAAKRQLLEVHKVNVEVEGPPPAFRDPHVRYQEGRVTYWCDECDHDRDYGHISGPDQGCRTLRLLALPYADHKDYDPAWRIDG